MKTPAAVLVRLKKPLELMDLEVPLLRRGQVLVRVRAAGVCGSQIGEIDGVKGPDLYLPHCLGHEGAGIVEDTGPGVRTVKPGDRVVLHWRPSEGLEAEPAVYRCGRVRVNAGRVTVFQERTVVSENRVTAIGRLPSFAEAALLGCALTTGFGSVRNDAKVKKGESVLVLGTGGIGQAQILAARHAGARPIIACDLSPDKLRLSLQNGATAACVSGAGLAGFLKKTLKGRSLDVVFENTGKKAVIEFAYASAGPKGRVILVGVPDHREKVEIDTLPLHFGKILTGSHGGAAVPHKDIPRILSVSRSEKWRLDRMVNPGYRLSDINRAIEDLRSGRALRPVLDL